MSDDTNHDGVFVDHVIRDIINKYHIENKDLWIQSDNTPSQYKNKQSSFLLKKLSEDFNLRIILIYRAAGHEKGAIDGMSNFEVKNISKKDIITTYDVCPQFSYTHLPSDDVVKSRISQNDAMIIKGCMK